MNNKQLTMNKTIPSSTGGTITFTKTGLIHRVGQSQPTKQVTGTVSK